jgi:hypothetical protein
MPPGPGKKWKKDNQANKQRENTDNTTETNPKLRHGREPKENGCGKRLWKTTAVEKKPRAKMQQDRGDMKKTASKQHAKKKKPKIMPKISGKIGHSDTIDNNHQKQSQDPWKNSAPGLGRQGCTSPT